MNILFYTLLVGALFHFIYEGILAPSLRLKLRFQVFAERDKLRSLRSTGSNLDEEAFEYLHDSINTTVSLVHSVSIFSLIQWRRAVANDPALRARITQRAELLDRCDSEEVQAILKNISRISTFAIVFNSAGFFMVFVLPVFLIAISLKKFKNWVHKLVLMPLSEIERRISLSPRSAVFPYAYN